MLCCLLCPKFSAGVKIEFFSWINELFVYYCRGGKEKWISLMNVFARHIKIKAWDQKQKLCSENKPINSSFLDAILCGFFFFLNLHNANYWITFLSEDFLLIQRYFDWKVFNLIYAFPRKKYINVKIVNIHRDTITFKKIILIKTGRWTRVNTLEHLKHLLVREARCLSLVFVAVASRH